MEAKVIQVIRTMLKKRGSGVGDDPIRYIEQFWSLDGKLLMENDPCEKCRHCGKDIRDEDIRGE